MTEYSCGEPAKILVRVAPLDIKDVEKRSLTIRGNHAYWTTTTLTVSGGTDLIQKDLTDATYSITVEPL